MLVSRSLRRYLPCKFHQRNFSNQGNVRYSNAYIVGGLGIVASTSLALKYCHDHFDGTEGLFRAASFYSLAIPKYIVYRYHMMVDTPDTVWDELHKETSEQGLVKILELQGFYVKCGQMVASNIGDAFPPIWQDTMSILQDEVPPQPFSIIEDIINSELGKDRVFSYIDPKPIGSASIGQVHRAILKDGTPVVVKVCYPQVEKLLRGDVRTIKTFAQVAQPVHVPALDEIEKQFQTEFDYRLEAKHLEVVHDNLTKAGIAGPDKLALVPKPYLELCTKRVLVMEELRGDKLAIELKKNLQDIARDQGMTVTELIEKQKEQEKQAEDKGKTLDGPSKYQYDLYISMADGKRRVVNAKARLYNTFIGWVPGFTKQSYLDKTHLPLNHARLIDDLIYIHGHEVLVDGYFNGDPHPGNILLCRKADGEPILGLIDYGQVKKLSKEKRHLMAKIIIALADDNREEIVHLMKEAGFRSTNMNPDVIYLYAKVGYDQDSRELTNGDHIQVFMEKLEAKDPIIALPQDFIMVGRATLILRGLAHALKQHRSVAKIWRPIAERVLKEDL